MFNESHFKLHNDICGYSTYTAFNNKIKLFFESYFLETKNNEGFNLIKNCYDYDYIFFTLQTKMCENLMNEFVFHCALILIPSSPRRGNTEKISFKMNIVELINLSNYLD